MNEEQELNRIDEQMEELKQEISKMNFPPDMWKFGIKYFRAITTHRMRYIRTQRSGYIMKSKKPQVHIENPVYSTVEFLSWMKVNYVPCPYPEEV